MTPREASQLLGELMELLHGQMVNASPGQVEFQTADVEAMFASLSDLGTFVSEQDTPDAYRVLDGDNLSEWYPDMVQLIEAEDLVGDEPFPVYVETMRHLEDRYAIVKGVSTRFVSKAEFEAMQDELDGIIAPDLLEPAPETEIEAPLEFGEASEAAGLTGITDAMRGTPTLGKALKESNDNVDEMRRGAQEAVAVFQPEAIEPTLEDFLDLDGDEDFDKSEFALEAEEDGEGGKFSDGEVVND